MIAYHATPSMRYLRERFVSLFGEAAAARCLERVMMMLGRYGVGEGGSGRSEKWNQGDAVLITYADTIKGTNRPPLAELKAFAEAHFKGAFSSIHLLPFFPSSSDDGFSVIHYRQVDPALGSWEDVRALSEHFNLMVDLVLNHASSRSNWFSDYQTGTAPGRDYFIDVAPGTDLAAVVRPRTHPLLKAVNTRAGVRHVWTTFSADQVDLNYANPDVLFEMLDLMLFYVSQGARIFRLDAVAYLWKTIGTTCIHLPQTYDLVRVFRTFLRMAAPDALLLTETNVPHSENISYFCNGEGAHLVYQFSLPPLVLNAMVSGNAQALIQWATQLESPPAGSTFLNFTASHDGIGIRPLEGLVPGAQIQALVDHVRQRGGTVSMKLNSDGSESPYELNCTWFDVMGQSGDSEALHLERFVCSQTIPMVLQGVPAVYVHSMTATPNDLAEVQRTGRARSINRGRWARADLDKRLADPNSMTRKTFSEMQRRLRIRAGQPAFHPEAAQHILAVDPRVFCILRVPAAGHPPILTFANLSAVPLLIPAMPSMPVGLSGLLENLLSQGDEWDPAKPLSLAPYQCAWFVERRGGSCRPEQA